MQDTSLFVTTWIPIVIVSSFDTGPSNKKLNNNEITSLLYYKYNQSQPQKNIG